MLITGNTDKPAALKQLQNHTTRHQTNNNSIRQNVVSFETEMTHLLVRRFLVRAFSQTATREAVRGHIFIPPHAGSLPIERES